ncbi:MAG TPA: 4'-phosphopantetheinyl transferase superfamily protein [Dehalococcoidia bacterium]|nr:4'-phosphopantetheinyl transferase superfamily protein [Dehalococcoidia bacterium]
MMPITAMLSPSARREPALEARLRPGDVDLWRAELDGQEPEVVSYLQTLLSPDEAGRARDFYFERDRRRYTVARGILRLILGRYLGCPAEEVAFCYGPNGKPALAGDLPTPLYFNLTHSEGLALYAVTRVGEVGLDLERIRELPEWEQIAAGCFDPAEFARLRRCAPAGRPAEFLRLWTRQEAVLKALGVGLGGPRPAAISAAGFQVYPLHPDPGYVAALAVGPGARWTTARDWAARPAGPPRRSRRTPLRSTSADNPHRFS